MATTDVTPPPINVPIVNPRNGMPTPALTHFLYRLWQRTGGNDNEIKAAINLLIGGRQNVNSGSNGASDPDSTLDPIFALLQTIATRQASEIEALRSEVDALRADLSQRSNGQAIEAGEDADTAQAMVFAVAIPSTRSYSGI